MQNSKFCTLEESTVFSHKSLLISWNTLIWNLSRSRIIWHKKWCFLPGFSQWMLNFVNRLLFVVHFFPYEQSKSYQSNCDFKDSYGYWPIVIFHDHVLKWWVKVFKLMCQSRFLIGWYVVCFDLIGRADSSTIKSASLRI